MWLLITLVKFLHVAAAILAITGMAGRELMRMQARRSQEIQGVVRWIKRSGYFERFLVIPPSQVLLLAGIALAWLQGWPLFGFLQGASANWLLVSFVLTLSMIPLITLVFLPRGKIFEQRLEHAIAEGRITTDLVASFRDGGVRAAHYFEAIAFGIISYLMIAKPF